MGSSACFALLLLQSPFCAQMSPWGTHGCKASSQFDPTPASLPGSVTQHAKWIQNPGGAEGRQLTPTRPHTHSVPSVKPPCTSAGPEQRAPLLGRASTGSRPCPSCPAGSGRSPLPLAGPTEPSSLQPPEKESRLELGASASLSVPQNFKMKLKSGGSCSVGVQTTFSLGPLTQLENFMRFWGSELRCQRLRVSALWGIGGGDGGSHGPVSSGANTHYLSPGAHCGKPASPTPSSSLELALCCPFTRGPVLLPRASTAWEPIWKVADPPGVHSSFMRPLGWFGSPSCGVTLTAAPSCCVVGFLCRHPRYLRPSVTVCLS